jgi:hypothetical protein
LTARDPRSIYAGWDLSQSQRLEYASSSRTGQLTLRVYENAPGDRPVLESRLSTQAEHCFIAVTGPGSQYVAELGYEDLQGGWKSIARSEPVSTPRESASENATATFFTIPPEPSLTNLVETVREAASRPVVPAEKPSALESRSEQLAQTVTTPPNLGQQPPAPLPHREWYEAGPAWPPQMDSISDPTVPVASSTPSVKAALPTPASEEEAYRALARAKVAEKRPLLEAVQQLREAGWTGVSKLQVSRMPEWTAGQSEALARVGRFHDLKHLKVGSLELAESAAHGLPGSVSSGQVAEQPPKPGVPSPAEIVPVSSPGLEGPGGGEQKGFWLTVNAELVIYGATEKDARVSIAGRSIRLRPDGTFSFRFSLPDGQYPLRVVAVSADGSQRRSADLEFSRRTSTEGEVGPHPQNADLKSPDQASFG